MHQTHFIINNKPTTSTGTLNPQQQIIKHFITIQCKMLFSVLLLNKIYSNRETTGLILINTQEF